MGSSLSSESSTSGVTKQLAPQEAGGEGSRPRPPSRRRGSCVRLWDATPRAELTQRLPCPGRLRTLGQARVSQRRTEEGGCSEQGGVSGEGTPRPNTPCATLAHSRAAGQAAGQRTWGTTQISGGTTQGTAAAPTRGGGHRAGLGLDGAAGPPGERVGLGAGRAPACARERVSRGRPCLLLRV